MIKFVCPHCNNKIGATDEFAGKYDRCPKCLKPVKVPQKNPADENIIKFYCPYCNQKIGLKSEYAGKRVRCAKCKNAIDVPQAKGQIESVSIDMLTAGDKNFATEENLWGELEDIEKLLAEQKKARIIQNEPIDLTPFEDTPPNKKSRL